MEHEQGCQSLFIREVLPSQKDVKATVNVTFEELKNGRWAPVYTAGKEAVETKEIAFKTNEAPDNIPLENIVYAYPVVNQKYYLKGESNKGYIQLQFGQSYLFPAGMDNKLEMEDSGGSIAKGTGGDGTVKTQNESLLDNAEDGSIGIESKQASAETRTDIGKVLLTYDFSTGKYDTFKQKIDNIQKIQAAVKKISSDVLMFEYETRDMEPFDLAELTGTMLSDSKPLISAQATLEDPYYKEKIYPLIYQDYPVQGMIRIKNRKTDEYGVPPAKALPLMTTYLNRIESGEFSGLVTKNFPYYYNLPEVYKTDFIDLQSQVVNSYLGNSSNPAYKRFAAGYFPFILPGYYKIKLQYVLPGGTQGTSSTFDYYNFIN
jgi:hypothetical protein